MTHLRHSHAHPGTAWHRRAPVMQQVLQSYMQSETQSCLLSSATQTPAARWLEPSAAATRRTGQ
jgi:hypothetical protein